MKTTEQFRTKTQAQRFYANMRKLPTASCSSPYVLNHRYAITVSGAVTPEQIQQAKL